jgi:hypothetical protein
MRSAEGRGGTSASSSPIIQSTGPRKRLHSGAGSWAMRRSKGVASVPPAARRALDSRNERFSASARSSASAWTSPGSPSSSSRLPAWWRNEALFGRAPPPETAMKSIASVRAAASGAIQPPSLNPKTPIRPSSSGRAASHSTQTTRSPASVSWSTSQLPSEAPVPRLSTASTAKPSRART